MKHYIIYFYGMVYHGSKTYLALLCTLFLLLVLALCCMDIPWSWALPLAIYAFQIVVTAPGLVDTSAEMLSFLPPAATYTNGINGEAKPAVRSD